MRIVSVWLPRWPIRRFLNAQARLPSPPPPSPVDPDKPFILAAEASGGARIAALNEAAEAEGLWIGHLLSDARARCETLQARFVDPAADEDALRRLALWATRYSPSVAVWSEADGADGFFLDVSGGAHLFGGERALLRDLQQRLLRFHLPSRLTVADTAGAAWALSHFSPKSALVLPPDRQTEAIAPLPVEALRLSRDLCAALRRLGFRKAGALFGVPRAPFAARFETELLRRRDQALGDRPEPLNFLSQPPTYRSLRRLLEPILTQEAVLIVAADLMKDIAPSLSRDGAGARDLRLTLYRVDGETRTVDIGLATPTRDPDHIVKLFALKFERAGEQLDYDFGFDAVGLSVSRAAPFEARQGDFTGAAECEKADRCMALIDALRQRLSQRRVKRLAAVESHIPEKAEKACPPDESDIAWPAVDASRLRPLLLLTRPEAARVMAVPPDEKPRRFFWRGGVHVVKNMQGPERIEGEWWRETLPARDYYLAEDESGRRLWLYRERAPEPRWFVHGLFA